MKTITNEQLYKLRCEQIGILYKDAKKLKLSINTLNKWRNEDIKEYEQHKENFVSQLIGLVQLNQSLQ